MKYKVHICGTAEEGEFRVGFDVTVENGGSVAQVATAIQTAIDSLPKSKVITAVSDNSEK